MPLIQIITNDDNRDVVHTFYVEAHHLDDPAVLNQLEEAIWDEVREAIDQERPR